MAHTRTAVPIILPQSNIWTLKSIDLEDELEQATDLAWQKVSHRIVGVEEAKVANSLHAIAQSLPNQTAFAPALLYAIITGQLELFPALQWLSISVSDNYAGCIALLMRILGSLNWSKVKMEVQRRCVMVIGLLMKQGVDIAGLEQLAIRQIVRGCPGSAWLNFSGAGRSFLHCCFAFRLD